MNRSRWKKIGRIAGIGLGSLLLLLIAAFVIWGSTPSAPMPAALSALNSDAQVRVSHAHGWLVFDPAGASPETGFIFYPGGHVDYRAYAPEARAIAARGYRVVIVPMPLSLAVFGINRAADVIQAFPEIKHWALGGHSLGGSMAAAYVYEHPGAVAGLVLWASYPASNNNLAGGTLQVISIYGSHDGAVAAIESSRPLLPAGAQWVRIEGGNHGQFGDYGLQPGDGDASISRAEQQQQIVAATAGFLAAIGKN